MDKVIVPAQAVRLLEHLWRKVPGAPLEGFPARLLKRRLELSLNKNVLQARFGRVTLIVNLIQGTPPDFKQLIPSEVPFKVRVLAPDFERAVRRVQDMARDSSGIVRLTWSDSSMAVSAKSEEKGEVKVSVPVTSEGGDGRVGLNVRYLLDYLKGREGLVTMGVKGTADPVLFQHGTSPLVLIMPMFVQW